MPKRFFYFLLLLLFANSKFDSALGQSMPNLKFSHIGVSNGLSSDVVSSVFQDHRGIIWICTGDAGFNRYDGNSIKVFKHILGDSNSVPSNSIRFITEDPQHNLWISTQKGLYLFNPITERGKTINLNPQKKGEAILAVYCDKKGFVFVNTIDNIYEVNSKTEAITIYKNNFDEKKFLTQKNIHSDLPSFYEDVKNRLWLGTFFVNKEKKQLEINGFSSTTLENKMVEDEDKKIWTVTWDDGLKLWDESLTKYENRYQTKDKIHTFLYWKFKNEHYIVMTVYPLGLVLYNINSKTFKVYNHKAEETSLPMSDLYVYKDRENRLWITSSTGVSIVDPSLQNFNNRMLYKDVDENNLDRFGDARGFLETKDEFVVSGSFLNGLFLYTKDWVFKKRLTSIPPDEKNINAKEIASIFKDDNAITWYCTDNGLVQKSNEAYKIFLPNNLKDSAHNNDFLFRNIVKRPDGKFWIRNVGKKLFLFDPATGVFLKDYANEIVDATTCIALDKKDNNLWVSTNKGLYWLDGKTDKIEHIVFSAENNLYKNALNNLRRLYFDKENTLWITSEYGLIKFDVSSKKYQNFVQKDGLPEEDLLNILEDENGFLWMSTSKGIIRYDKKKQFNYYTAANGLPFTNNILLCLFNKLSNGNLLLGYAGGVVEFNPNDFKPLDKDVKAVILDVLVDNKQVSIYDVQNKTVTVPPNAEQLKIHFGLFNYTAPAYDKFYFYLEGVQNEWQESKDGNIVFYKLPAGKYTLRVKGKTYNSIGKIIEDSLVIIIEPRWYQTNLFKILLALLIALLVMGIVFFRSKQIRKKEKLKNFYENKMMHLEMQSLRSQMNPHFLFNTLNSINSYIIQNKTNIASEYLTTFSKLMRTILELSKQEKVTIDKEIQALKMYIELEALRLENKFDYSIVIDKNVEQQSTYIPSLIIQPFVENAIWHGLHNKPTDGHIDIHVSQLNEQLIISIVDDGIGRQAAADLKKQTVTHKSFGIDITINRIKMLDPKNTATITDLYNTTNEPIGTKVIITINNKNHD